MQVVEVESRALLQSSRFCWPASAEVLVLGSEGYGLEFVARLARHVNEVLLRRW